MPSWRAREFEFEFEFKRRKDDNHDEEKGSVGERECRRKEARVEVDHPKALVEALPVRMPACAPCLVPERLRESKHNLVDAAVTHSIPRSLAYQIAWYYSIHIILYAFN